VAALAGIGALFFAVMIGAAIVSLRWARAIFSPLEQMAATMQRVEAGALDARVGRVDSADEIGRLAGHLDHLLGVIDDNTRELRRWNAELDAKVAERTRALEDAQAQLVRNEKLAAVGQLTASIAHEINNPIAVIQGNLDLLRELLGAHAAPACGRAEADRRADRAHAAHRHAAAAVCAADRVCRLRGQRAARARDRRLPGAGGPPAGQDAHPVHAGSTACAPWPSTARSCSRCWSTCWSMPST
jgi:signal transduction histidine kinase